MEMRKPMRQLDTAPGYPGMVRSLDVQRYVIGDLKAGLVQAPGLGCNQAGHNQRLGAGACFRQPAFDEQLIETRFFGLGHGL